MVVVVLDTNVWVSALLNPHGRPARLKDAWLAGRFQVWVTETVDLACQNWYPSLVVDAAGQPHISYFSYWPGTLLYARRPYQIFLPVVGRGH